MLYVPAYLYKLSAFSQNNQYNRIISVIKTIPITNKTKMKCSLAVLLAVIATVSAAVSFRISVRQNIAY